MAASLTRCRLGAAVSAAKLLSSQLSRSYVAVSGLQTFQDIPPAVYGGRHTVTVIPGDGIGPELMAYAKEVVRFSGAPVDFEEVQVTSSTTETGLNNAILALVRNGVGIKGTIETNHHGDQRSLNIALRKRLDLYASVVRCQSLPFVVTKHSNVDTVIIRENTEGEYSQLEHENVSGVVESLKIITTAKSKRIAKYAFDYAVRNKRKKVTAVHKANIMKLSDGLFLECCREVAKQYPAIEFGDMIVDNCAMQMVSRPQQFDVMVMPNLYGNILVNVAAGLVGGPGVVVGGNFGEKFAIFEQGTRNSGRSIKGMNVANPSAMLLAAADMLRHIGLEHYGDMIHSAVVVTMTNPLLRTADLGGKATTLEVVQAVIQEIKMATKRSA